MLRGHQVHGPPRIGRPQNLAVNQESEAPWVLKNVNVNLNCEVSISIQYSYFILMLSVKESNQI
jgi:hypothetical protein